ncbi:MAG: hypothetical protein U1F21_14165 [Sphaerotilus natans]
MLIAAVLGARTVVRSGALRPIDHLVEIAQAWPPPASTASAAAATRARAWPRSTRWPRRSTAWPPRSRTSPTASAISATWRRRAAKAEDARKVALRQHGATRSARRHLIIGMTHLALGTTPTPSSATT